MGRFYGYGYIKTSSSRPTSYPRATLQSNYMCSSSTKIDIGSAITLYTQSSGNLRIACGDSQDYTTLYLNGSRVYPVKDGTSYYYDYAIPIDGYVEFVDATTIKIYDSAPSVGYTVSYSTSHGIAPSSVQGVTEITEAMLPPLTDSTFAFNGWYYESTFTTHAQAGDTISADTTLYAKWTAKTYTVNYNANGGKGTIASQTKTHGISLTLSDGTGFSMGGFKLKEWNTASDGGGTTYALGATYSTNATVAMYAVWESETYTIEGETLKAIGGAIRSKTGEDAELSPEDMADTITDELVKPQGTKNITSNGTFDISEFASAIVEVPAPSPTLQSKTATENGTVTPDSGYDGLSQVVVNVSSSRLTRFVHTFTNNSSREIILPPDGYDGFSQLDITVSVPPPTPTLQSKTATANGTVTADSGYDGLSSVIVAIPVYDGTVS